MTKGGAQASAPTGAILRAQSVHQRGEAREAGLDRLGTLDRDRLRREAAQHQEAHGDPVVELGVDGHTAGGLPPAMHDQVVALDLDR